MKYLMIKIIFWTKKWRKEYGSATTSSESDRKHTQKITEVANLCRISMLCLWCFTENLHFMEIPPDPKPAHNPQLSQCTVLQIRVPWIQRCFTGLKSNLTYFRVEWADRSIVFDWQQYKEERKLKPTRREAMPTRLCVCAYRTACVCVYVCLCVLALLIF